MNDCSLFQITLSLARARSVLASIVYFLLSISLALLSFGAGLCLVFDYNILWDEFTSERNINLIFSTTFYRQIATHMDTRWTSVWVETTVVIASYRDERKTWTDFPLYPQHAEHITFTRFAVWCCASSCQPFISFRTQCDIRVPVSFSCERCEPMTFFAVVNFPLNTQHSSAPTSTMRMMTRARASDSELHCACETVWAAVGACIRIEKLFWRWSTEHGRIYVHVVSCAIRFGTYILFLLREFWILLCHSLFCLHFTCSLLVTG